MKTYSVTVYYDGGHVTTGGLTKEELKESFKLNNKDFASLNKKPIEGEIMGETTIIKLEK